MSIESRSRQYGKVFDHWQIKEFLGSGSGGKTAVFRLLRSDSSWGVCALKIVNLIEERGDINELSDFRRREYEAARDECSRNAEQEVRLMDDLRGNTNIVDYLDHTVVDWSDEIGFGRDLLIRMELLKDLRSELRNGRMFSEREVLKIGRDICVALIRCHRKDILHRDVKPENIFRNKDGDYKLGDFSVSRVLDACPGAVASTGIGTYEYWPAEQMTGRYDKRVDIYSLGLVLYELSNQNRLPFAASSYATGKEVSLRLSGTALPEPSEASPALARVILKACAFNPDERYQSAEEFLKALNLVIRSAQDVAKPNIPQAPAKQAKSHDDYATALAKELGLQRSGFADEINKGVIEKENDIPIGTSPEARLAMKVTHSYQTASTEQDHILTKKTLKKEDNDWIEVFDLIADNDLNNMTSSGNSEAARERRPRRKRRKSRINSQSICLFWRAVCLLTASFVTAKMCSDVWITERPLLPTVLDTLKVLFCGICSNFLLWIPTFGNILHKKRKFKAMSSVFFPLMWRFIMITGAFAFVVQVCRILF